MKNTLLLILLLSAITSAYAQTDLKSLFTNADSVIIIYHKEPWHLGTGSYPQNKSRFTAHDSLETKLFINGTFNPIKVIKKRILNDLQRKELTTLFTGTYGNKIISSLCWEPQHTIEIYSAGHCSYLTLCFRCYSYMFTDQTSHPLEYLPEDMWPILKDYFIKNELFE